jgi:hypothetical protein
MADYQAKIQIYNTTLLPEKLLIAWHAQRTGITINKLN